MGSIEKVNWGKPIKNKDYVVMTELPDDIQPLFEKWLFGKRRPVVFAEGDNMIYCAYYWDYTNFMNTILLSKDKSLDQLKQNQQ
jgi:hypothetical protein